MSGLTLLAPLGLGALITLPAIVLFHMRHTTPPVRPVPTLRFWLAAEPERTEQTRFRRPPLSLLLVLQLLIATAIAASLARPATTAAFGALDGLGWHLQTDPRHLILLLDGSTSMSATDTASGQTRFNVARSRALDRLSDLREGDVATVLVLGTRTVTLQGTDSGAFARLRDRVGSLDPPGGRADLDAALTLAHDLLLPDLDDQVVLITDGALAADAATISNLGAPVDLVRVGAAATGNLAITEFSARPTVANPDQREVYVRVVNFSDVALSAPAVFVGDGIEVGRKTVDIAPGASTELNWLAPLGTAEIATRVEYPDALPADNEASLLLRQEGETGLALRILLVTDTASTLQRLLQLLPNVEVTTQGSDLPLPTGGRFDLIAFEKTVPAGAAMPATPMLFINPPQGGPFAVSGTMSTPVVSRVRAQDSLLAGVDLGGVTFGETPIYTLDGTKHEIVGAAEGPLIFRGAVGEQPAVVISFDLTTSNLPRRVAFPILVQNIVSELAPSPLPSTVGLGDALVYRPRSDATSVHVTPPGSEPVLLSLKVSGDAGSGAPSDERLREVAFADTGRPGVYQVTEEDATAKVLGGGRFVVNAGHPRESDLRANADLAGALAGARASGAAGGTATVADLWPPLVAIGLGLLAMEWLIALLPRRGLRSSAPLPASSGAIHHT